MRFVPIARARLCFLPRKGEFSAFLTLFGEKSHQSVRARKAPKPLRRALFSLLHTQKSALCHSSTFSNSRPSRHRLFPIEFRSRARVFTTTTQKNERNFAYLAQTKTPSRFCTASLFGSRASCIPCNTFVEFLEPVYDVRKRPHGVSFRKFLAKLPRDDDSKSFSRREEGWKNLCPRVLKKKGYAQTRTQNRRCDATKRLYV